MAARAKAATFAMSASKHPHRPNCTSSLLRRARHTVSIVVGSLALAAPIF